MKRVVFVFLLVVLPVVHAFAAESSKETPIYYPSPSGRGVGVRETAPMSATGFPHPDPLPEGEGIIQSFPKGSSLERIAAGLSRPAVLRAEFTQTKTVPALTRPIVTSGRFVYARQQGILWKIEQPYRATFALNDNGMTELDTSGTAVRQTGQGAGMQHVSRIFRALFEPDFQVLQQYFDPTASGDANRWELTLAPRGALRQVFKQVRVRGGRYVEEVRLAEVNGDTTAIRFLAMQEAAALDGDELRAHRRE